jgi:hypothetical protein
VSRWTLTVPQTCTPRAGPCARLVPNWAFIGAQSVNSLHKAGITMRRGAPPLIPPPQSRSLSSVTSA